MGNCYPFPISNCKFKLESYLYRCPSERKADLNKKQYERLRNSSYQNQCVFPAISEKSETVIFVFWFELRQNGH